MNQTPQHTYTNAGTHDADEKLTAAAVTETAGAYPSQNAGNAYGSFLAKATQQPRGKVGSRRSEIVLYGQLPAAVRIVVDAQAEEYWPQVEAELAQILGDEDTVTDSFWRTLKEIDSIPVCTHERQEGRLRITDDGLTAYLVCSTCGHPQRELPEVTAEARSLLRFPVRTDSGERTQQAMRRLAKAATVGAAAIPRAGCAAARHATTQEAQVAAAQVPVGEAGGRREAATGAEAGRRHRRPHRHAGDGGREQHDGQHVRQGDRPFAAWRDRVPRRVYDTASADVESRTAPLHEPDLMSRGARTCKRAGGNGGRLEPLGSGVRGRTRGFDSRRLGLKANQRMKGGRWATTPPPLSTAARRTSRRSRTVRGRLLPADYSPTTDLRLARPRAWSRLNSRPGPPALALPWAGGTPLAAEACVARSA